MADLGQIISAILATEGSGPTAVSAKGATGQAQIMPATFEQYRRGEEHFKNESDRMKAAERKIVDDYYWAKSQGADDETAANMTFAAYQGGRGGAEAWRSGQGAQINDGILNIDQYVARANRKLPQQAATALGPVSEQEAQVYGPQQPYEPQQAPPDSVVGAPVPEATPAPMTFAQQQQEAEFARRFGGEGRKSGEWLRNTVAPAAATVLGPVNEIVGELPVVKWQESYRKLATPGIEDFVAAPSFERAGAAARGLYDFATTNIYKDTKTPKSATDFRSGFNPPVQGPVQEYAAAPPVAEPDGGPPQGNGLKEFLGGLVEAYNIDQGAPLGGASAEALGAPGTAPVDPALQTARDDLKRSRTRLEEKIDAMAKGSTLPDSVFKDRLANVLVGIALGYAGEYSRSGDYGKGFVTGLASGGGAGLQYNKDLERRQDRIRLENLASQRSAIAMEGQLHTQDAAAVRAGEQNALYSDRTKALHLNSIREADARLRAARMEQMNPLKLTELAIKRIDLEQKWAKLNNPMLDVKVMLPSGVTQKIGELDPRMQQAYMAAKMAPEALPQVYYAALARADAMIEAGGGKWDLRALGGSPAEQRAILADMFMAQHFMKTTNLFEGAAQE